MATELPEAAALHGATVKQGAYKTTEATLLSFIAEMQTKGSNVASAGTTNIGAVAGNYCRVTGNTTIVAFDNPTAAPNVTRIVQFAGILTLTHHTDNLILPGGVNITTAAGDIAMFVHEGAGSWRCLYYQPAAGYSPTAGPGSNQDFAVKKLTATIIAATAQPAFKATGGGATNVTGNGTGYNLICGTEVYDKAGNYNTSTGQMLCSVAGNYDYQVYINIEGIEPGHTYGIIQIYTDNGNYGRSFNPQFVKYSAAESDVDHVELGCPMDIGDVAYVTIAIYGGAKTVDLSATCRFSGHLVP